MIDQSIPKSKLNGRKLGQKAVALFLTLIMIFTATVTTTFAASISIGPKAPGTVTGTGWTGIWAKTNPPSTTPITLTAAVATASDSKYATLVFNSSGITPVLSSKGFNFNVPN